MRKLLQFLRAELTYIRYRYFTRWSDYPVDVRFSPKLTHWLTDANGKRTRLM